MLRKAQRVLARLLGPFANQLVPLWAARLLSAGLAALSVAVAARHLGLHDFGLYGVVVTTATAARQLFDSRSHEFLITFISAYSAPDDADKRYGIFLVSLTLDIASALLGAVAVWLAGDVIARLILHTADSGPVAAGALVVLAGSGGATASAVLMLDRSFTRFSIAELWGAVFSMASVVAAAAFTHGAQPLIIATAMAAALATFTRWIYAAHQRSLICRGHHGAAAAIRSLRRERSHLLSFALGNNLHATLRIAQQQLPALLVSGMTNVSEAASVVLAQRLTAKMQMLSFPVQQAAYPQFARESAAGSKWAERSTLLRAVAISGAVVAPFVLAFCLGARYTLPLLVGSEYLPASATVQVTVLACAIGVLLSPLGALLIASRRLGVVNLSVAAAATCQLLGSLLLIPRLGGLGAAAGLCVYYVVQAGILVWTLGPLLTRPGRLADSEANPDGQDVVSD